MVKKPNSAEFQALPCFKCGKELENVSEAQNQPYDGVEFTTHGHYGTTVFDPMFSPRFLALNICDTCLVEHKDKVYLYVESDTTPKREYSAWNGTNDR